MVPGQPWSTKNNSNLLSTNPDQPTIYQRPNNDGNFWGVLDVLDMCQQLAYSLRPYLPFFKPLRTSPNHRNRALTVQQTPKQIWNAACCGSAGFNPIVYFGSDAFWSTPESFFEKSTGMEVSAISIGLCFHALNAMSSAYISWKKSTLQYMLPAHLHSKAFSKSLLPFISMICMLTWDPLHHSKRNKFPPKVWTMASGQAAPLAARPASLRSVQGMLLLLCAGRGWLLKIVALPLPADAISIYYTSHISVSTHHWGQWQVSSHIPPYPWHWNRRQTSKLVERLSEGLMLHATVSHVPVYNTLEHAASVCQ